MFCINCGTKLSDDAKFCISCGSPLLPSNGDTNFRRKNDSKTKFVPAKCTGCGASLEVNASEQAAICPYCNNAYIVEKAINNYNISSTGNVNVASATINVSGVNVGNLLLRAKDFEIRGDFKSALIYYNQVLDIDFSIQEAHDGIAKMKEAIDNFIYFESATSRVFSTGILQLKKDRLVYISSNGKETVYYLDRITNLSKPLTSIQFNYANNKLEKTFSFPFNVNQKWFDFITSAKKGIYPTMELNN